MTRGWRDAGAGYDGSSQFPFLSYQSWGAWLGLAIAILWQGRRYFSHYITRAIKGDPEGMDKGEPMTARGAICGLVAGCAALVLFVWSSGGSWWMPLLFLSLYLLLMLALTRVQAEVANPSPLLTWVHPQNMIASMVGTSALTRMDAVHMGMLSWFNTDYRAAAMPHQLQSMVGQKRAGGSTRGLAVAMMLATAAAIICSMLWDLQLYYSNGAGTSNVNSWRIAVGVNLWGQVKMWMQHPTAPTSAAWVGAACGAPITGILSMLRTRFVGFPLSPLGYVVNTSWANDLFWVDMLIAWIFKTAILRYGGSKGYRAALPVFLGLILGDFVTGAAWSIIGALFHLNLFRTFSN